MPRRIKLSKSAQLQTTETGTLSYKIVVTASDGESIANEIFRHRRLPLDPNDEEGASSDQYEGVATVTELSDLPINNPNTGEDEFRKDSATIIQETQVLVNEAWETLQADVDELIAELDSQDTLGPPAVYWAGAGEP